MNGEISASPPSGVQRWLRHIVIVACMLGLLAMLAGIGRLLVTGNKPGGRDIVSFWVAGRQIAAHASPYDAASTLRLERSVGFPSGKQALIMRNPPYALALVLPLALFSLKGASLFWSILLIGSLALSIHLFWTACGRPANKLHLLGYTFSPALICIMGGQTAIFALLGLVLFLRFSRERGFAAGVSLWLCALKPHLFLPFGLVLLMWVAATRRYGVLAGAMAALAAGSAIAVWLDPSVWMQYAQMMRSPNLQAEFIPSLSYQLRALHPRTAWLQYVPAIAGCGWAAWFYLRLYETWNWLEDGALVMLVSLLVAPYAWISDQAVLIPALLAGVYRARTRTQLAMLGLPSLLIELAQLLGKSMHSPLFVVAPCYWLGWYLYATKDRPSLRQSGDAETAFAQKPALQSL